MLVFFFEGFTVERLSEFAEFVKARIQQQCKKMFNWSVLLKSYMIWSRLKVQKVLQVLMLKVAQK